MSWWPGGHVQSVRKYLLKFPGSWGVESQILLLAWENLSMYLCPFGWNLDCGVEIFYFEPSMSCCLSRHLPLEKVLDFPSILLRTFSLWTSTGL